MRFSIDYDMSISELLRIGDYNNREPWEKYSRELMTIAFPISGTGKGELMGQILDNMYLQVAVAEANRSGVGIRYPVIQELLAFGAAYPTCQLYSRIVCLGTTVDRTEPMGRKAYFHGVALPQPESVKKLIPCLDVEDSIRTARLMPLDSLKYSSNNNYLVITERPIRVA